MNDQDSTQVFWCPCGFTMAAEPRACQLEARGGQLDAECITLSSSGEELTTPVISGNSRKSELKVALRTTSSSFLI